MVDNASQTIIIGAGPAGMSAAIQLRRHGIDPIIFEKDEIGGLLKNANLVENYPGFPGGISGPELVKLFKKQLESGPFQLIFEEVINLDHDGEKFLVKTATGIYHSLIVLAASGTKPKVFTGVDISDDVASKVFYEIYPILGVKGRKVIIVGAGDAAFDYALNLEKNNEVVIINRGEKIQCLPLLRERAKKTRRIKYHSRTSISKIADNSRKALKIECMTTNGTFEILADHLVFAIGRERQLGFMSNRCKEMAPELEQKGFLHFAGDVKNGLYRQTAIAVGDAIMAAMKISGKLNEDNQ